MIDVSKIRKKLVFSAEKYGTPLYVYSQDIISENINSYKEPFKGMDVLFCYALKANSNKKICKIIARKGFGADVVSGGELKIAIESGFEKKKIIFSGAGKTEEELLLAVKSEILFINVESEEELDLLSKISLKNKKKTRFSIRINPNVDPHTHNYISTGKYGTKFGVSAQEAVKMYKKASKNKFLTPIGIHFHLGSQVFEDRPYKIAFLKIIKIVKKLRSEGVNIRIIDIGGGWGVREGEKLTPPNNLAKIIAPYKDEFIFILEPGRSIVASSGFFVVKTLYKKKSGARHIVIVDGGMNDFIRPSLYGVRHPVLNLMEKTKKDKKNFDIYGPVCESGDFLLKNAFMPVPDNGDFLCFMSAGAYGYSMGSNYNMRPRPAEVLISSEKLKLARKRQKIEDLF